LETEKVLVREQFEEVDCGGFVEEDVSQEADTDRDQIALVRLLVRINSDFELLGDITGSHRDEETGGVEGYHIVQFEFDPEARTQQEGEVVDPDPHRHRPFDGEIMLLVEVQEVPEPRHPNVRRNEDPDLVVH